MFAGFLSPERFNKMSDSSGVSGLVLRSLTDHDAAWAANIHNYADSIVRLCWTGEAVALHAASTNCGLSMYALFNQVSNGFEWL